MTTSTFEVGDLFSILGAHWIEWQLQRIPGVDRVSVNPVSGSTTVEYDPGKTGAPTIQTAIRNCGFHCAGQALPKHGCDIHKTHDTSDHRPTLNNETQSAMKSDAMAREMGHGGGMDLQAMVRDMRNRFWIALAFSLPIFVFSPLGMDAIQVPPPFGLRLDLVLFALASGAILYPVWPFFVAAYRGIRSGVANMAVLVVLSVGTGYLFSVGATFFYGGQEFFEASAILLDFILLGHWLEMRARAGASEPSARS